MIPVPYDKDFVSNAHKVSLFEPHCVICGKVIHCGSAKVYMVAEQVDEEEYHTFLVTEQEADTLLTENSTLLDMQRQSIHHDCMAKHPELQMYVWKTN